MNRKGSSRQDPKIAKKREYPLAIHVQNLSDLSNSTSQQALQLQGAEALRRVVEKGGDLAVGVNRKRRQNLQRPALGCPGNQGRELVQPPGAVCAVHVQDLPLAVGWVDEGHRGYCNRKESEQ
jgi:hypothetical protein